MESNEEKKIIGIIINQIRSALGKIKIVASTDMHENLTQE